MPTRIPFVVSILLSHGASLRKKWLVHPESAQATVLSGEAIQKLHKIVLFLTFVADPDNTAQLPELKLVILPPSFLSTVAFVLCPGFLTEQSLLPWLDLQPHDQQ